MESIKTYEIPGCISCRIKFALGKAQPFEAYFDGGIPDKGYPAIFVAKGIGKQLAIENSELFKKGKIRLKREKNTTKGATISKSAAPVAQEVKQEQNPTETIFANVENIADAISILKGEYKVSASRLKTPASILRVASDLNISFPNLKF